MSIKNIVLLIIFIKLLWICKLYSQVTQEVPPQGITYQGVAAYSKSINYPNIGYDNNNMIVSNKKISVKFHIIYGDTNNNAEYVEEHSTTTSNSGLFTLIIGKGKRIAGNLSAFNKINWSRGAYFLKVEIAIINKNKLDYLISSVQQIMSVPYALYAQSSGSTLPKGKNIGDIIKWNGTKWIFSKEIKKIDTIPSIINNNTYDIKIKEIGGKHNTGFGYNAIKQNDNSQYNSAFGYNALNQNTGNNNNAFGYGSLANNTSGNQNSAFGNQALLNNSIGSNNSAFGNNSLSKNLGDNNIALGYSAGENNTTGNNNIFIGGESGSIFDKGSHNISIGDNAGTGGTDGDGNIYIGSRGYNNAMFNQPDSTLFIADNLIYASYDKYDETTRAKKKTKIVFNADNVYFTGKTYFKGVPFSSGSTQFSPTRISIPSDMRLKRNIKSIDNEIDILYKIKPYSFKYKQNIVEGLPKDKQFGFIAQDLEKHLPNIVKENVNGYKYVQYDQFIALIIATLKRHKLQKERMEVQFNNKLNNMKTKIKIMEEKLDSLLKN